MTSHRNEIGLRLDALVLGSPDPARLTAFYSEQMGMRIAARGDDWALLEGPGRRIVVRPGHARQLQAACYRALDRACFEGLHGRLEQAGVPIRAGAGAWYPGREGFTFLDPEGHEMVVLADGPLAAGEGMPGRLQHVVFASPSAPDLAAFYREVVGFVLSDEVFDDHGRLKSSFVRSDPEHHSLAVFDGEVPALDHYCFETPDWAWIRDWADHFARFGTKLFWGPGRHGPGNNLFFMVLDADGNRIEISCELEEVPAGRAPGNWPFDYRAYNSWGPAPLRV